MATPAGPPRRHGPPAVGGVLLIAVLVGVAAALLSRPVSPVGWAPPSLGGLSWSQLTGVVTIGAFVGVGLWLFFSLRDVGNRTPIPGRVVATLLVILLLGVLFLAVSGLVHVAPIPASSNSTGKTNSTGGTGPNGGGNTTLIHLPIHSLTVPAWVGIVGLVAVAVGAAVLLVPALVSRVEHRRRDHDTVEGGTRAAQRALVETLKRLGSTDASDARAAILALYARLLVLVGPRLGPVESRTPGEICRSVTDSLGVRPRVARDLTDTFEEARYSSHPMSPDQVVRARAALAEAVADLALSERTGS